MLNCMHATLGLAAILATLVDRGQMNDSLLGVAGTGWSTLTAALISIFRNAC